MIKKTYPSISGLRALSVMLVMFSHLVMQHNITKYIGLKTFGFLYYDFSGYGQIGVNIFFLISGFLITTLMLEEEETSKTISLKKFYIRRTLRIFPAYFFLLFVYFILQLYHVIYISNPSWLTALTYTKYLNWKLDWYTAHAWSLSIEEQFYLFWPLVFILGNKVRKNVALFLFFLVPAVRIFTYFHPVSWINELTIFVRIDGVALGCLFALHREKVLKLLRRNWTLAIWSSIAVIFLWYRLFALIRHLKFPIGIISLPLGLDNGTMENIAIAILLMYSVFGPQKSWFKFINSKVLNYIGILSYSLYLWQQLFINVTGEWYNQFPVNIFCIVCAALISYYLIEMPFLKLKNKFSGTMTGKIATDLNLQDSVHPGLHT